MGFIGIVVSLSLLIFFAYRGVAVVLLAPVLAMLAVWMEGSLELLPAYTNVFMVEMGSFIAKLFPLFLLGSIFGKLLEKALFAESIAQFLVKKFGKGAALVSIITACGILTYGGVSAFVVCFSMVPLARRAFSAAKISHRLIPGALACGALTFSMTCLPGTVQVHNLIPMSYFKTTPFAAPLLGILGGLAMFLLGVLWMEYRKKKESFYEVKTTDVITVPTKVPDFIMAISPIVLVIALNWIFSESRWNVGNWSIVSEKFKEIDPAKFKGTWAMVMSLTLSSFYVILLSFKTLKKDLIKTLESAAKESMLPAFNTGSEVGYGATIAALGAFAALKAGLFSLSPNNPLMTEWISVNVLAGITGSASGGLAIALGAMGDSFVSMAQATGVSMEHLHRIASMSSGGLDSLPHNGAVITLLAVCNLTHKDSYKDIFVVSVLIPLVVTLTAVLVINFIS